MDDWNLLFSVVWLKAFAKQNFHLLENCALSRFSRTCKPKAMESSTAVHEIQ